MLSLTALLNWRPFLRSWDPFMQDTNCNDYKDEEFIETILNSSKTVPKNIFLLFGLLSCHDLNLPLSNSKLAFEGTLGCPPRVPQLERWQ